MRATQPEKPSKTFADRLNQALDNHPNCPKANFGRLRWVVEQMAHHGQVVTSESVRRWLESSMPRKKNMVVLCDILDVDEQWLVFGATEPRGAIQSSDGGANIVAGLMLLHGLAPELPSREDRIAEIKGVHLRARSGRHLREFHIAVARETDQGRLNIEIAKSSYGCIVLVVVLKPKLTTSLYRLDYEEFVARADIVGERVVANVGENDPSLFAMKDFDTL